MATKTIRKHFNAFQGIDRRSSDLTRSPEAAIAIRNARFTRSSDLVNRNGSKILGPNGQYLGHYTHTWSSTVDGSVNEEMLSVGAKLYRRKSFSFTVAYANAANPVQLNIYLVTTASPYVFRVRIVEGTTQVLDFSIGTGLESSPITLAALRTAINAVAGFTCTVTGDTTKPAALVLPTSLNLDLASGPKSQTITWYDWEAVNETVTDTFANYYAARGNDAFELCSMVNARNVAIFATGYEPARMYDGQTLFRLGVPEPAAPTLAVGGGGALTGTYTYIQAYVQVDNRGNRIEGTESVISASVAPAAQSVNATCPNLLANSGYNTNCALVNGNQVGVTTITVTNSPHTMKVGDTAYFLDRSTGSYVERLVTATTATTITIAGANVNVNNTDVISNNLRIAIYRIKNGGIDYFSVAEIPNNSFAATQVYNDNKADTALGLQYLFAADGRDHDILANSPRYLVVHQEQLIAAGSFSDPDTIFISLPGEPWYFPIDGGSFDVISTRAGGISGLGSDGTFLIAGKESELFIGSGDFSAPGQFRFERFNQSIGFACHNTIREIGDGIAFLSKIGFYTLRGGSRLVELGEGVNKVFGDPVYSEAARLQLKRSFGLYWESEELFVCYVPCESGSGTSRFANSNALIFTYDTFFEGWIDWTALNMGGGMCIFGDELWWQSRRDDTALTVTGNLWRMVNQGNIYDFADHDVAIDWRFEPQWDDGGEPSTLKLVTRMRIYSLIRDVLQAAFAMTVKTEIDYGYGLVHSNFMAQFGQAGSAGYGYGAWGSSPWGSPVTATILYKLRVTKLRSIRFLFSHNTIHEKVAISGWEYEMSAPYREEMK